MSILFLDNLLKARQKCKKAESDSELATDLEEDTRRRKKKVVFDSDDDESDGGKENYIKISYPKPPNRSLDDNGKYIILLHIYVVT